MVSVKCPKCGTLCEFKEGKLFGFCNKCGSVLERDISDNVVIYDKTKETDENIVFAMDRFDICSSIIFPNRSNHDFESFTFEIEKIMDQLITFSECMKDIFETVQSSDERIRFRTVELCGDMVDRIFTKFETFVKDYPDFGLYDELKSVQDLYNKARTELSSSFAAKQRQASANIWAGREQEYEDLKKQLADAKMRKTRIPFYNLADNWAADNEIAELEKKLSGKP